MVLLYVLLSIGFICLVVSLVLLIFQGHRQKEGKGKGSSAPIVFFFVSLGLFLSPLIIYLLVLILYTLGGFRGM